MTAARAGVEAQRSFFALLGMPTTLEEVGGKLEDIPLLAHDVLCRRSRRYRGRLSPAR